MKFLAPLWLPGWLLGCLASPLALFLHSVRLRHCASRASVVHWLPVCLQSSRFRSYCPSRLHYSSVNSLPRFSVRALALASPPIAPSVSRESGGLLFWRSLAALRFWRDIFYVLWSPPRPYVTLLAGIFHAVRAFPL